MYEDFGKNVKGFLLSPVEAFKQTGEKSLGVAYQYYVMLLVIFTALYGVVTLVVGAVMFNSYIQQVSFIPLIGKLLSTNLAKFSTFVTVSEILYI